MRRHDFGEADRILTLFSREYGKLRVISKGSRKARSKQLGHVELFMQSRFMLAKGRNLDIVTQVELIESHQALAADIHRATWAAYIIELLESFTPDEERNLTLYDLLSATLKRIATDDNTLLAARYYEMHLLDIAGYRPQLFYCVVSGDGIENEDQFISADEGGLIRPERVSGYRARPISAGAVKVLRFLQTRPWDVVSQLQLRPELHQELEMAMQYYLQFLLEKGLKSAAFIQRLRRENNQ